MSWIKTAPDQWIWRVPPDARFTAKVFIKGDRRWSWEVFAGETESPMATGIVGSLGAAKNVVEQLIKRVG